MRLVAAARRLSQVTAQMITDLKVQAESIEGDSERQTRLFAAAKQLADSTTDLINEAKVKYPVWFIFLLIYNTHNCTFYVSGVF